MFDSNFDINGIYFTGVGTLYSFGILVDELKKEFDGYVSWILSLLTALGALSGNYCVENAYCLRKIAFSEVNTYKMT